MHSVPPLDPLRDAPDVLSFGPWRLDRRSGELRQGDAVTRLQEQPLKVLELLVLRAGQVVTREELITHVWPRGVVIDFDTGVNTAVRKLRSVLGDDAEHPRFIETLPRRGYRLLPQEPLALAQPAGARSVPEPPSPPVPPPAVQPAPPAPLARTMPHRATRIAVVASLAIIAAGLTLLLWRPAQAPGQPPVQAPGQRPGPAAASIAAPSATEPLPDRTIAVLPFRALGSMALDETLAVGLAESVLHQLSSSPDLRVIARGSSFAFREAAPDFQSVARRLQARYLLDGTLQTESGRLRLTTQLIDGPSGRTLWSLRFDRRVTDVFAVQDEIATQVARILRASLANGDHLAAESQGSTDVDAYFEYLQGRSLTASRRVVDLRAAEAHLTRATSRDPAFAAAFAELARARELLLTYDPPATVAEKKARAATAQEAARRSLELAPGSARSLVAVGSLTEDPEAAMGYLRRAIAINPNLAIAWLQIAELKVGNHFEDTETLPAIEAGLRLDPLDTRLQYLKALYYFMARGDLPAAQQQFRATLAANPEYYAAYARLAQLNGCCLGSQAEGVRYAEQALRLDPDARWVRRMLVGLYLDLGETRAAEQVAHGGKTRDPGSDLLLDLHAGRLNAAVHRAFDPANGAALKYFETSERLYFGRLALLTPGDAATLRRATADAADDALPGAGMGGPRERDVVSMVDHAALLLQAGDARGGNALLQEALDKLARQAAAQQRPSPVSLAELQVVALALQGNNAAALDVLEQSSARGAWPYWWYYAQQEPAFAGLRAEPRFKAWVERSRAQTQAEREKLRALRVAGLVPERGGERDRTQG